MKNNMQNKAKIFILGLLSTLMINTPAQAAKIIVANDEWTLSDKGFAEAPDTDIFVKDIAKWFAGDSNGKFHAYSTNFGLTESSLAATMTGAGYTWTTGLNIKFDLPTLLNYDGIFLAGNPADNDVLIDYVEQGGNVYIAGGTGLLNGFGGEAASWNTFLNHFGLGFAPRYNRIIGNVAINNSYPLMNGVSSLYNNDGSDAVVLDTANPHTQVIVKPGLYAVYNSESFTTVPEASSALGILALGAVGTVSLINRRKKSML